MKARLSSLKRLLASPRTRMLLVSTAAVLAIAAVIFVAAALSAPKSTPDLGAAIPADPAAADYQRAVQSAQSGQTTAAVAALKKILAANPKNTNAKSLLAELQPSNNTTTVSKAKPPTDDTYTKPVSDLSTLLPTGITGYRLGRVENGGSAAVLTAEPTYTGPYGKIVMAELTVHDQLTEAAAAKFTDNVTRKVFPAGFSAITVGDFAGRFGTDSKRSVSIAFHRGRYVFETIITVARDDPATYKSLALAVAASFPAAHR